MIQNHKSTQNLNTVTFAHINGSAITITLNITKSNYFTVNLVDAKTGSNIITTHRSLSKKASDNDYIRQVGLLALQGYRMV